MTIGHDLPEGVQIRLATNADCDGIIALIDGVLAEYGDRICLEPGGSEADLKDVDQAYRGIGGEFWVLEKENRIVGCHATRPDREDSAVCTFKRLYLDMMLRGTTCGHVLMQATIDWARNGNFRRIEFWSDTRFERAHRFFEKFGFQKNGESREMNDSSVTYWEYFFYLDLR